MRTEDKTVTEPKRIFEEWEKGNEFKSQIGRLGIFEQAKMNERFFVGDQWYGAACGNERPLVRRNIIKRIGEYKMSAVGAAPVTVNYSAQGIPLGGNTAERAGEIRQKMTAGEWTASGEQPSGAEISVIMEALTDYGKICAERVGFELKSEQLLRNAYISGTGIAYTYWDPDIKTGLFADTKRTKPILGDIAFEIPDVENVVFGDPNSDDVQSQPYILIAQRTNIAAVRREAQASGENPSLIVADDTTRYSAGERGEREPDGSERVTVITKFYRIWDEESGRYRIMAVKVTKSAVVRAAVDTGLTLYPLAVFRWENRRSSAYGDSEITYLIPNQIAINRMLTAECWSAISVGMPKLLVNNDMVDPDTEITNDPGQIIRMNVGYDGSMNNAMQYVAPPYWAAQYRSAVEDLASGTTSYAGANDAALGNVRPDNAAAIIEMREAALQPMQLYRNRYYAFIEDIARIWADFWISRYAGRPLTVQGENGVVHIPFNSSRYGSLTLTARVDVGASSLWSEAVVVSALDGLLKAGIITPKQYLERLPKGIIPKTDELIAELSSAEEDTAEGSIEQELKMRYPQEYEQYMRMNEEERREAPTMAATE